MLQSSSGSGAARKHGGDRDLIDWRFGGFMTSLCSRSLAAMVVVIAFAACKKEGVGGAVEGPPADVRSDRVPGGSAKLAMPAVLAYVPANTPYLIAGIEALPPDVLAKLKRLYGSLASLLTAGWQRERERSKVFDAVLSELDGKWSEAGMESLGFSTQPRFAAYGLGLQPFVVRVAVKDHKAVLATIERVAARAGEPLPAMSSKEGRGYWRYDNGGGVSLVLALADNQLVFAVGKTADVDAKLGLILGVDKPPRSMADGAVLRQLMARHGLSGQLLALADSQQMIRQGLAAANASPSPTCKGELDRLSTKLPRVVFGYRELSAARISSALVLELAPDAVGELRSTKSEIPGLAAALAAHPMMAFAAGVDLSRAQQLAVAMVRAVKQLGLACDLDPLVNGALRAAVALGRPLPEPIGQISGGVMVIDNLVFKPAGTGKPAFERLDGILMISSPDARALFRKAIELEPQIGQLGVTADGRLHPVTSPVPLPSPIAAGVGGRTIVVTLGDQRSALGAQILTAQPGGKTPLFAFSYDVSKLMDFVIERGAMQSEASDPGMMAFMQHFKGAFGQVAATVDVTDQGLALSATLELK